MLQHVPHDRRDAKFVVDNTPHFRTLACNRGVLVTMRQPLCNKFNPALRWGPTSARLGEQFKIPLLSRAR